MFACTWTMTNPGRSSCLLLGFGPDVQIFGCGDWLATFGVLVYMEVLLNKLSAPFETTPSVSLFLSIPLLVLPVLHQPQVVQDNGESTPTRLRHHSLSLFIVNDRLRNA